MTVCFVYLCFPGLYLVNGFRQLPVLRSDAFVLIHRSWKAQKQSERCEWSIGQMPKCMLLLSSCFCCVETFAAHPVERAHPLGPSDSFCRSSFPENMTDRSSAGRMRVRRNKVPRIASFFILGETTKNRRLNARNT